MSIRLRVRSLLAALAVALPLAGARTAVAQRAPTGYFELSAYLDDDGEVQLTLGDEDTLRHGQSSFGIAPARLVGLDAGRLRTESEAVHFRLVRDAGTIDFTGRVAGGRARGRYTFSADPRFVDALTRRSYEQPDASQQFQLALYDVGLALVDELRAEHYERPAIDELVRMGMHGATLGYLRSLDALGYRVGTVDRLVTLRDHGVTARYVGELADAGYRSLDAETLRELRDHGVTGAYVRDLARLGLTRLDVDDVRRARDHGVTASFVEGIQRAGFTKLPLETLIQMRDHGVTPSFAQSARTERGATSASEVIRLRDRGARE